MMLVLSMVTVKVVVKLQLMMFGFDLAYFDHQVALLVDKVELEPSLLALTIECTEQLLVEAFLVMTSIASELVALVLKQSTKD